MCQEVRTQLAGVRSLLPYHGGARNQIQSSHLTDTTHIYQLNQLASLLNTYFFMLKIKKLFLIGKTKLIILVPILINGDMSEPSYDLKFTI